MKKTNEILPLMKDLVKKTLEEMVKEERAIYLEEKKGTKAISGLSTRKIRGYQKTLYHMKMSPQTV